MSNSLAPFRPDQAKPYKKFNKLGQANLGKDLESSHFINPSICQIILPDCLLVQPIIDWLILGIDLHLACSADNFESIVDVEVVSLGSQMEGRLSNFL